MPGSTERGNGEAPTTRVFEPRSREERWVRPHSSHLLTDALVYMNGAFRLIAGIFFRWFPYLAAVVRPSRVAGWPIAAAHPVLRARLPIAEVTGQPDVVRVEVLPEPGSSRYRVIAVFTCGTAGLWSSTTGGENTMTLAALTIDAPGVVPVAAGKAEFLAQPTMRAVNAAPGQAAGDAACAAEPGSDTYTPLDGLDNGSGKPTLTVGEPGGAAPPRVLGDLLH
jgi:hypothetical protein